MVIFLNSLEMVSAEPAKELRLLLSEFWWLSVLLWVRQPARQHSTGSGHQQAEEFGGGGQLMKPGAHQVLTRYSSVSEQSLGRGWGSVFDCWRFRNPHLGKDKDVALPDNEHLRLVAAKWLWQGAQWEKRT